ncbi:hypothetical protein V6X62_01570 [Spiribacter sp. 218]|uniref:hypothetical protein n=1 Tax=Spiribacter pallidus TaxID=1987936 RepID=UPI00349F8624
MVKVLTPILFLVVLAPFAVGLQDEQDVLLSDRFLTDYCAGKARQFSESPSLFNVRDRSMAAEELASDEIKEVFGSEDYIFEKGTPSSAEQYIAFVETEERQGRRSYQCYFIRNDKSSLFFYQIAEVRTSSIYNVNTPQGTLRYPHLKASFFGLLNKSSVTFANKAAFVKDSIL